MTAKSPKNDAPFTVFDVAKYILNKKGQMSSYKLQKLVYYSQAWSLVWHGRPLFGESIQAWANGPVVKELFDEFKGRFTVSEGMLRIGKITALDGDARTAIDAVLKYYGPKTGQWLSELTHLERPWIEARAKANAAPGDRCDSIIDLDTMYDYYSGLTAKK